MTRPSPGMPALKYRKDIDGLRAVAVLPVVLFHLDLPIHGGFVGVDVFFTISGFLIGSIILSEVRSGRFSFARFYERRIRRIFPALFSMLFASSVVAYFYLLPPELADFALSLVAAVTSVSNLWFWSQAGYFDAAASSKPLLHTWSLAVEEQFYIFFPVMMFFMQRLAQRRIVVALYAALLLSFCLSAYGAFHDVTATFYAPYTRAWELLLGTVLALDSFPTVKRPISRHLAGAAGLTMIVAACFLLKPDTPFPGLAALPPCVGAALIIAAGKSGPHVVGRLLSIKPIAFIGLISYSLYLWHWPLIAFTTFGLTILPGLDRHQYQLVTFLVALLLATLSWRFVELPFRTGAWRPARIPLFIAAASVVVVSLAWNAEVVLSRGLPDRFSADAKAVAAWTNGDPFDARDQSRNGVCFMTARTSTLADFKQSTCLPERPGSPSVLLLGDSHAAALWWGLNRVLSGTSVMQATASGCKPVLNQRPRQFRHCAEMVDFILHEYLASHTVDAVLLEAHWDSGDIQSLGETVMWLKDRHVPVILVGPNVQYDGPLPRFLAYSITWGDPSLSHKHLIPGLKTLDAELARLADNTWHVPYISLFDLTCKNDVCDEYAAQGVPMLFDYGHFTKQGSIRVASGIAGLGVLPATVQRLVVQ